MKKLPRWSYSPVFAFLMAGCMTCLVSLISTLIAIGLTGETITIWMVSWGSSFLFAFPVTVVVVPVVRAIANRLVDVDYRGCV